MRLDFARAAVASAVVCLVTWLALAIIAGNVGLQRSISMGAITLFERPVVVVVVASLALVLGYVSSKRLDVSAARLLVGVLVGNGVAGLVIGPLVIGELEASHAPMVIAAVSLQGVQPAAAFAGAWAAGVRSPDVRER
ncbi:MAG: hypothetical protein AB1736_05240 [Chloroflexota bacterium]